MMKQPMITDGLCDELVVEVKKAQQSQALLAQRKIELEAANENLQREVAERQQTQAELELSERRLSTLMGNLQGMAFRCLNDEEWTMVYISQGCEDLTGYQPSDLVGNHEVSFAHLIHPEDSEIVHQAVQAAVNAGDPWKIAYRICKKNGEEIWGWDQGCAVYSENGEMEGLEGFILDISSQKRAEFALEEANENLKREIAEREKTQAKLQKYTAELENSNRDLEDFAYIASHDLQEPLRKIQSFGDRLESKYSTVLEGKGIDYLQRMCLAANRMSVLITDLLSFSRINSNSGNYARVDLNEILNGVLSDLEVLIQETKSQVTCQQLPFLEADTVQIRQLFQNLIGNAIKYRDGERAPKINISCEITRSSENGGDSCEIAIEDNGIGFEKEYADRIFEIFQRLHGRSDFEGTGVGLAVVRKIAERHGGSVSATSTPGEGSIFRVTLKMQHPISEYGI